MANTLKGQAFDKIQEEACLTSEGVLVMLELLSRPATARTYMALKRDKLRVRWIKRILSNYIENQDAEEYKFNQLYIEVEVKVETQPNVD